MKQGWEIKKLSEIGKVYNGNSINEQVKEKNYTDLDDGLPFIATKDISYESVIDYDNGIRIPFDERSTFKTAPKDTVLICAEGGSAGRKIGFTNKEVCFGNKLFALATHKNIESRFVYYYYFSSTFQKHFANELTGLIGGVSMNKFRDIEIPLPTHTEQKRIIAILDKSFEAIAKAKANAEQNLKNVNELFESNLQSVFGYKNKGWKVKMLGEVANTNGRIGWKGLTAKEYTKEGPLFISVHSLNYGDYVDFRDAFHISQTRYDESPEIMLKKNDILICKDGAGIGKLGIIQELHEEVTINSSLLLIRCKKEILTKYLYYNLLSPIFQSIVQSRLSGATTPHLYQRDIVTFPILLPTIIEQEDVIQKLDALSAKTKKLKEIYKKKIEDLEELKRSILQKAFTGELTTSIQTNISSGNVIQLQKIEGITATDLQAGITALALQKHLKQNQEDTFHHVKAEKIVHLTEYILNVDLERNPIKDAAGPNDFPRAKFVESRAKKAGFYTVFKNGEYYDYRQGNKIDSVILKAQNCLGEKSDILSQIIDILIPMTTQQAEIVATVYAAWNNLILSGNQFTDDKIATEARENWNEEKLFIPKQNFLNAIEWMRKNELFIPKGNGKIVRAK